MSKRSYKDLKSLDHSLVVFSKWSFSLFLTFFGQVMSHHHSDQKFNWSQVSRIVLWGCFEMVFVFVIVFFVKSCLIITLIKYLKGHKSLGSLCNVKIKSHSVSQSVTRSPIELSAGQLKTEI